MRAIAAVAITGVWGALFLQPVSAQNQAGPARISALTLFVLFWTLRAVREYTRQTQIVTRTAVEQLPRPCVTILQRADTSDLAILNETVGSVGSVNTVWFVNVGTGPAVNVRFSAQPVNPAEQSTWYQAPALGPGERFDTGYPRNSLENEAVVLVEYESVGGAKYRSESQAR